MWTTSRTKQAVISPRPVRVAYIVPNPPTHDLLNVLFNEAMSRWGGRRTPLILSDGAELAPGYWSLLSLWDADIIYSYVNLTDNLHSRLAHRLAPCEVTSHPHDARDLRPRLKPTDSLLSSASMVPLLGKRRSLRAQALPQVLDKERHVDAPRDLGDSFNFASSCLNDFTLLPYAKRTSLRPPGDRRYAQRFSSPEEIAYIQSLADMETMLAEQAGLLCLAQMSDMLAPCLSVLLGHPASWDEHLSIVVGDDVADRVLFWNGIHRYETLMEPGNFQLLRLSPDRFVGGIPAWVAQLCSGQRNWRHLHGNAAPRTVLRSCSVEQGTLNEIAAQIRAPGMIMSSAVKHGNETLFEPLREDQANARGQGQAVFISGWQNSTPKTEGHVRFEREEFEVPLVVPFHLKEISAGPTNTGAWAIDLRIERNEDHSVYGNRQHRWMFPRRLRVEAAVEIENYGHGRMAVPPLQRPTEEGDLAIWDGLQWKRPLISMPTDLAAFAEELGKHHPQTPTGGRPRDGLGLVYRFSPIQVSDKGDLLGVLQLFRSLPEALIFLTNPYWLSVIHRLCPTEPDANAGRVQALGDEIRQAVERRGEDVDIDRIAKRAMRMTAGWIDADSKRNASISYSTLVGNLPNELRRREWRNALERSVQYLRDRNFLRQGYDWKCDVCQHPNWAHLEDIVPTLHCEICRTEKSSPVCDNNNVHFKLNPFVAAAFSASSSQGPVAWALNRLANRTSWSFMFTPAVDVYRTGERDRFTDVDVLASVDGEVYLLEVKKSFAGINEREIEKLMELVGHRETGLCWVRCGTTESRMLAQ